MSSASCSLACLSRARSAWARSAGLSFISTAKPAAVGPSIRNDADLLIDVDCHFRGMSYEPPMAGRNDVIDGVPGRFIEPTVMPAVAAISGNASSHLPMELLECRILRVGYADNIGEPDCFVRLSNVIAARLRFGERKKVKQT